MPKNPHHVQMLVSFDPLPDGKVGVTVEQICDPVRGYPVRRVGLVSGTSMEDAIEALRDGVEEASGRLVVVTATRVDRPASPAPQDAPTTLAAERALRAEALLADANEIRSAYGFLLMRMAVAKDAQDAHDIAKREFQNHEAALKRLEEALSDPARIKAVDVGTPIGSAREQELLAEVTRLHAERDQKNGDPR